MKARVKETGEIVDGNAMVSFNGDDFYLDELEAIIDETEKIYDELDEVYWEKLKHQYAGMAMQGVLANADLLFSLCKDRGDCPVKVVAIEFANACAHALVEKYKKEEK